MEVVELGEEIDKKTLKGKARNSSQISAGKPYRLSDLQRSPSPFLIR